LSKRRIVIIGVLLGIVVIGGVGAIGLWTYHEQPQFCATCHIMDPYLASWENSDYGAYAHAVEDVTCLECHEPTTEQQINELVVYLQGDFTVPLAEREFGNEFCFDCHEANEHTSYGEVIQLTADLALNPHGSHLGELECEICHKMHRLSEDYCADCHGSVATGAGWTIPVSLTAEVDVWTPDMDCAACHVMVPYIESLEDEELLGYAHAQEGADCVDCHSDQEELQRVHEEAVPGEPVAALSVDNEFCFDCHLDNEHMSLEQVIQRTEALDPNPHDRPVDELDCGTCHKIHEPSTIAWSPETDCSLCHLDPQVESLEDPSLLAYDHAQEGLECLDCHTDLEALGETHVGAVAGARVQNLRVEMQFCFDCHVENEHTSYRQIIELTAEYIIDDENINPHEPHPGSEVVRQIECYTCHKMHNESLLISGCYGCHHEGTFQACIECHASAAGGD
jgi:cytochrome c nitrite reductase small subunit